ncbi:DNA-binding protein [Pedobacter sp. PF22-3]|uniref:DNA-binding protein n=1 Tax=Pedobacter sp. PF22-3 TaxID=2994467 RepID=UPI002248102F|nr:DNA-binding protein [Pedobacter sp. PF22-3]MCX2495237.1 DNA-binding protein [Pedobacter sp. PF22-3]
MENKLNTKLICFGEQEFYELIEALFVRLKASHKPEKVWLTNKEVMAQLDIKSPTTLQKLRDQDAFVVSEITRKNFLYLKSSVDAYLEKKARKRL